VPGLAGVRGPHTDTPEPGGAERKTAVWNHAWCKRRLGFVDEAQFTGKRQNQQRTESAAYSCAEVVGWQARGRKGMRIQGVAGDARMGIGIGRKKGWPFLVQYGLKVSPQLGTRAMHPYTSKYTSHTVVVPVALNNVTFRSKTKLIDIDHVRTYALSHFPLFFPYRVRIRQQSTSD
jgi:hypothetical protein